VRRRDFVAQLCAFTTWSLTAHSQTYLSRPVTIIVPYPPGGPTDASARFIAPHLGATLGQSVVIENISGAGSNIGTGRVARAAPDGSMLLFHNINLAANATLYSSLSFSIQKDLSGIGLVDVQPFIIVGRKTLPANSMAELIAWIKQRNTPVNYAHIGAGSLPHLTGVLLAKMAGVEFNMIPYRGGAPVLTDIIGGHADLSVATPASAGELIRNGAIKAFAVTSQNTVETLPTVPSAVQLGYHELDILYWNAVFAPSGTPRPIIERLAHSLQLVLSNVEVRRNFEQSGTTIVTPDQQTPEAATMVLRNEIKRWGKVIRVNKIELQ
jgi:tripartite-type tricarboxylate transporter receptor subunit TctC